MAVKTADMLQMNLIVGISGIACLVVCTAVLSLLLLYRTHKTFLQRSLVYFTIAVFLQLATQASQLSQYQFIRKGNLNTTSCAILGFVMNYLDLVILKFFLLFMSTLAIKTYRANNPQCLKLDNYPLLHRSFQSCFNTYNMNSVGEAGMVMFCVSFPLIEALVPLTNSGSYGLFWGLCWISGPQGTSDSIAYYRYIYSYIPLGIVFVTSFGITLVLTPLYCYHAIHHRQYPHYVLLLKKSLILISVLALVQMLGVVIWYIVATEGNIIVLKMGGALLSPFFLFQVLAFLKYLYSIKKLSCAELKKAARDWKAMCCGTPENEGDRDEVAVLNTESSAEAPSNTYYTLNNTGQFPTVTSES